MTERLTINRPFHVAIKRSGTKQIQNGAKPFIPAGRVPRISRLLALAHHCFRLVQTGAIINQSELAHFGQISTTRMTQDKKRCARKGVRYRLTTFLHRRWLQGAERETERDETERDRAFLQERDRKRDRKGQSIFSGVDRVKWVSLTLKRESFLREKRDGSDGAGRGVGSQ